MRMRSGPGRCPARGDARSANLGAGWPARFSRRRSTMAPAKPSRAGAACRAATAASCPGWPTARPPACRASTASRSHLALARTRRQREPAHVPRCLPGGASAAPRRALGHPDHAAPGPAREPAPHRGQRDRRGGPIASAPAQLQAHHRDSCCCVTTISWASRFSRSSLPRRSSTDAMSITPDDAGSSCGRSRHRRCRL
jgi:hypothetical protein